MEPAPIDEKKANQDAAVGGLERMRTVLNKLPYVKQSGEAVSRSPDFYFDECSELEDRIFDAFRLKNDGHPITEDEELQIAEVVAAVLGSPSVTTRLSDVLAAEAPLESGAPRGTEASAPSALMLIATMPKSF